MITEYFVCSGPDIEKLHEAVNQSIRNGWQPLGGVAVSINIASASDKYGPTPIVTGLFCQAVIKETADQAN
jgi:hypothetical protein